MAAAGSSLARRRSARERVRLSLTPRPRVPRPGPRRAAAAQVEPRAVGQRVDHRAGDHDRPVALGLVGVGLHAGTVDHRHGALADHLHRSIGVDDRARVLVQTDAEQRRRLRDHGQQPPEPAALLEVLVDHDALQHAEPGGELRHALLGGLARTAERHHVRRHRARAGGGPGEHGAAVVRPVDRVGEAGAGDDRGEAELVPAGKEDRGRVVQGAGERGASASDRSSGRRPVTRPIETLEQLPVAFGGDVAERGRSRYDDVAPGPSGEAANRDRISLSRTLSSAPPISMTGPAPPRARQVAGGYGFGNGVTVRRSVALGVRGSSRSGPFGVRGQCADRTLRRDRRAGAGPAGRGVRPRRRCPRAPTPPTARSRARSPARPRPRARRRGRTRVLRPMDPNRGGGVEPTGGLVRALQDLDGPVGELERHAIIVRGRDPIPD